MFINTFERPPSFSPLLGLLGFVAAYLTLFGTFHRKSSYNRTERLMLLFFVFVFVLVILTLFLPAQGAMLAAAIGLGVILCVTGVTMTSALVCGDFTKDAARLIASAGILMFLSDILVAYTLSSGL